MKVAVILSQAGPNAGGSHTFEQELVEALMKSKHTGSHEFVLFSFDERIFPKPTSDKITFQSFNRPLGERVKSRVKRGLFQVRAKIWRPLNPVPAINEFKNQLLAQGIEFVWYMNMFEWNFFQFDIPYLITVWDLEHRVHSYFPEMSAAGRWEKRDELMRSRIQRAARLIAGTQVGAEELQFYYQVPSDRIRIIPHPTPSFALGTGLKSDPELPDRLKTLDPFLFYPAQFWAHKNHIILLKALVHLRDEYGLEPPLVLVGSDQGNKSYIRQQVKDMGLISQVYLLDFIERDELIACYQHALALAYSSLCGPENLPPLEAFALKCPVLAARFPGSEEQLGDAALLVEGIDDVAWAKAIYQLMNDAHLRGKLITKGKQRAQKWQNHDFLDEVIQTLDEFQPYRDCWS